MLSRVVAFYRIPSRVTWTGSNFTYTQFSDGMLLKISTLVTVKSLRKDIMDEEVFSQTYPQ